MALRRSRLEIYYQILKSVSKEKLTISHVLYKSGTSYYQVRRHLDFLIKHNLVKKFEEGGTSRYGITDKGKEFLDYFAAIEKIISD